MGQGNTKVGQSNQKVAQVNQEVGQGYQKVGEGYVIITDLCQGNLIVLHCIAELLE